MLNPLGDDITIGAGVGFGVQVVVTEDKETEEVTVFGVVVDALTSMGDVEALAVERAAVVETMVAEVLTVEVVAVAAVTVEELAVEELAVEELAAVTVITGFTDQRPGEMSQIENSFFFANSSARRRRASGNTNSDTMTPKP